MAAPLVLAPMQSSLGVFTQCCVPRQETLILKDKILELARDNFSIKDINGVVVLECVGRAFSFSNRKEFTAADGTPLFTIRTKRLHLHKTFEGEAPDGSILFTVKAAITLLQTKMVATFKNAVDGQPIELVCKGDWLKRNATITLNDQVVAQISRNFLNMRGILGGKQTYMVSVAPGVDLALIAAICVCLDEKQRVKNNGGRA